MTPPRTRPGYIFLMSVLIAGAIIGATAVTMILLSLGAEHTGLAVQDSLQAYEHAQTCAERGLLALRSNLAYAGRERVEFDNGSCTIDSVAGAGNDDRVLCVTGQRFDTVRRLQIQVDLVHPKTVITAWEEVDSFTLCSL